jgi:hypothetical protein
MCIFTCSLLMLLLRLQTKCLLQVISLIRIGTIPTPCTTVQMHLSRDSVTAGEPEHGTLLGVDTRVRVDAGVKGLAKSVGLVLEVGRTGLNSVDQSKCNGLLESQ